MKKIRLSQGYEALVDDEDFDRLSEFPAGMIVDHINHDTLDNRRSNLRLCSLSENVRNSAGARRDCQSGFRGVYWHKKDRRWMARIGTHAAGTWRHLGSFKTFSEAAAARVAATEKIYGEFGGRFVRAASPLARGAR
jgi:hypothetical protein